METLLTNPAASLALLASGAFFMAGLLTGAWKYLCMRRSERREAPFYVNIAHRAALMYAVASILIAIFAALSALPNVVNVISVLALVGFFALAIVHYIKLGFTTTTNNHMRDSSNNRTHFLIMNLLTAAEIGGFAVLFTGVITHWLSL